MLGFGDSMGMNEGGILDAFTHKSTGFYLCSRIEDESQFPISSVF